MHPVAIEIMVSLPKPLSASRTASISAQPVHALCPETANSSLGITFAAKVLTLGSVAVMLSLLSLQNSSLFVSSCRWCPPPAYHRICDGSPLAEHLFRRGRSHSS